MNTNEKELLNCPFCGENPVEQRQDMNWSSLYFVACSECGRAESKRFNDRDNENPRELSIIDWNTRTSQQTNGDIWKEPPVIPTEKDEIVFLWHNGDHQVEIDGTIISDGFYKTNIKKWAYIKDLINTRQQSVSEEKLDYIMGLIYQFGYDLRTAFEINEIEDEQRFLKIQNCFVDNIIKQLINNNANPVDIGSEDVNSKE